MPEASRIETGLWPAIARKSAAGACKAIPPGWPERLGEAVGPAMASHLLARVGLPEAVATDRVNASRLVNRLTRTAGLRHALRLQASGVPVLALKGLVSALTVLPDPDLRALSDVDLLVHPSDREKAGKLLESAGLRPAGLAARSPWGPISDASGDPFVSADGAATVDLHVHGDAWPLHRGLPTADLFAAARRQSAGEGDLLLPHPTHHLLLLATHAARDLFRPASAKNLVDSLFVLETSGRGIDWDELSERARRAGLAGPVAAFLAVQEALGFPVESVPGRLRRVVGAVGRAELARAVAGYGRLLASDGGSWDALRREWLLAAGPAVAFSRGLRRAGGLVRRLGTPG